jgi:hypothetical protein
MNTEDFVMFRRSKEDESMDDRHGTPVTESRDILRGYRSAQTGGRGDKGMEDVGGTDRNVKGKGMGGGTVDGDKGRGDTKMTEARKGNRWVRFLDVALTVPSDESDDELNFCKPGRNTTTNKQSNRQQRH